MVRVLPELRSRVEDGRELPMLLWRFDPPLLAVASGPLGGGIGVRRWALNATVPMSYARNDPDAHLCELADRLELDGAGLGFLTGVDVRGWSVGRDEDAVAVATVGVAEPEWAAAPPRGLPRVGTINILGYLPERLSEAALVNAVGTVTEAKVQALWELGYPGTGTATDAVAVLCPADGPAQPYGGPRSTWGARLARAVREAVLAGDRNALNSDGNRVGQVRYVAPEVSG
jgi:adenosylcobinamide amidohydrolase